MALKKGINVRHGRQYGDRGATSASELAYDANTTTKQKIDALATEVANKADLTDLAPAFSTATVYTVGQYVSYGGDIYKCTSAHSAGAWAAGDFTLVAVGSELESKQDTLAFDNTPTQNSTNPVKSGGVYSALADKANTDMVAADFNAGTSYTAGNYCIYEGKFYKFKNNHSGAWSAADVDEIKIAGELSAIKSGLTNVTANAYGTYVDISGYTSDMYTCGSDGYLLMATNTTSTITAYVYGRLGNDYMSVSSINGINTTVYVRKGMRLLVHDTTGSSTVARFYPLVV